MKTEDKKCRPQRRPADLGRKNNKTYVAKSGDIDRKWHKINVAGKVLGRQATQIACLLMGKDKSYFTRRMDGGDYIVVVNASQVCLTGRKEEQKFYKHYSGYPGGQKIISYKKMLKDHPDKVIRHAVRGMLPKNKLRSQMLKRLFVFAGEEHPYAEKFKEQNSKLKTS